MAREFRAASYVLEAALYIVVAGSALAIGAVHPWAYVPLWLSAAFIGPLVAVHRLRFRALGRQLGPHRFAFHASGRWLVMEPGPDDGSGWGFDLSPSTWPRAPLLWPGLAFLAWAVIQLLPLPAALVHTLSPGRGHLTIDEVDRAHPLSIDAAASLRGLAFAASMLVFHMGAAALAEHAVCRRRFRSFVAWFGAALALIALAQVAVAARRIYGVFMPLESETFYGVFVNRNHFAAYMTLCAMTALAVLHRALRSYRRLGARSNLRRQTLALGKPEGVRLILALVPVFLTIGALIASTSRAGILAFLGALVLASVGIRRHRQRLRAGAFAFVLVVLALAWFGLDRLEQRFSRLREDEIGRTAVWRHSMTALSGAWLTGAGLNTFGAAITQVLPLAVPAGATHWPSEVAEAVPAQLRIGRSTPAELPEWQWHREAHNDYVQLAVEMGVIGAAIGIWGLVMLILRMREPWLAAGVAGILVHSAVDFSLQIPAVAVLFFTVSAYATRTSSERLE